MRGPMRSTRKPAGVCSSAEATLKAPERVLELLTELEPMSGIGPVAIVQVLLVLGPRLNAAGRLQTALDALELLLATEPSRAESLAAFLDEQNRERQAVEKEIVDEVIAAVRAFYGR